MLKYSRIMLHTYILTMEDTFIVDIIIVTIPGEVEAFNGMFDWSGNIINGNAVIQVNYDYGGYQLFTIHF